MRLIRQLEAVGRRLRLIQPAAKAHSGASDSAKMAGDAPAPPRPHTRTLELSDLMSQMRAEGARVLSADVDELMAPSARLFEAAGLSRPSSGWTVERLEEELARGPYAGLTREAAQAALAERLAEAGASAEEVVRDAVERDRLLDRFEDALRGKLAERRDARERRVMEIDAELLRLGEEKARLEEEDKADEERFTEWHHDKTAYEKAMARAVGFLIADDVISVDDGPDDL